MNATREARWWFQAVGQALKPCRLSIAMLALGIVVFMFVDQTPEALVTLCKRENPLPVATFVLTCLAWGHTSWYFARVLSRFAYLDRATLKGRPRALHDCLVEWAPRFLGVAPMLLVTVALLRCAGRTYAVIPAAIGVALAGLAFGWFVVRRRDWIARLAARHPRARWFDALTEELERFRTPDKSRFSELPPLTRRIVWAHGVGFLALVVVFAIWPLSVPGWLGAQTIVVLALASWVVAGSGVAHLASQLRMPLFLFIAVYAVVVSPATDDHAARRRFLADPRLGRRPDIRTDFENWRRATGSKPGDPFVVVAAEGGGIRAAYFTAAMLASLQDTDSTFASHVYAISSVSGGSVGAAVFEAVVAAAPANRGKFAPATHRNVVDAIFRHDLLAPPVARMLFPDLVQRFVPFLLPGADRGAALELAWTGAVRDELPASRLFEANIDDESAEYSGLPRLYFNATHVETGERVVISRPKIGPDDCPDCSDGETLVDFSVAHGALASARFPYVTPAETIPNLGAPGAWGHLVDGGYFENSGTQTAADILAALKEPGARLVVLRYDDGKCTEGTVWATEVTSPPEALLMASVARESLAIAELKKTMTDDTVADLVLRDVTVGPTAHPMRRHLPLGWMLSAEARTDINSRVDDALKCDADGSKVLRWWSSRCARQVASTGQAFPAAPAAPLK